VDQPINSYVIDDTVDDHMYTGGLEAIITFAPSVREVQVRMATSFISAEQASLNLARELPADKPYEAVRAEAEAAWDAVLLRSELMDVGNTTREEGEHALQTWYGNVFRASIYPRHLFEIDQNGLPHHYAPDDPQGRVFPGRLVADSGFWDAYRTVYALNSLYRADEMAVQMEGWINSYKEGGHLPSWSSPGDRGTMTGNMQDAVVADAIVKGIGGFNHSLAYQGLLQDAFVEGKQFGRKGLAEYMQYGYIPSGEGIGDEVSATLNYALADHSMALAARKLGDNATADVLEERAKQGWRVLWDGSHRGGFLRAKNRNGTWDEPFDEFAWGGAYTEAGPWQYRFYVPHEPAALRDAYAAADGSASMCDVLEAAMSGKGPGARPGHVFHNVNWGLHHEQTEMVENCFGQYEHNNQPVWHQLYMFAPAGCAARGDYWLRQALVRFYGPRYYSGDEDNGSMASWFVLSAMGLYQLAPGSLEYSIGSPLYRRVELSMDNGKKLIIAAPNNSMDTPYVNRVSFNGQEIKGRSISYEVLRSGGTLSFDMWVQPPGTRSL